MSEVVGARGIDPEELQLSALDQEMLAWLDDRVGKRDGSYDRLMRLIVALNDPYAIDLEYKTGYTGTAREVFASGTYNCLSYSHLFLGMARELGIDVHYMSVDWIRRFRQQGDVVLVSGHVTIGYGAGLDQKILHFNVGDDINYRTARVISDLTAAALHYSNRGAELIQSGDLEAATQALETSRRLDPSLPDPWVNLGVVRRRQGDLEGAEEAYLQAIELDVEFVPAYRNLATVYDLQGEEDAVLHTLEILDQRGNRNPYAYLALGDEKRKRGDLDEAERLYRRALKLSLNRSDPLAALGLIALARGDRERAQEWLDRAAADDLLSPRVFELRTSLESGVEGEAAEDRVSLD